MKEDKIPDWCPLMSDGAALRPCQHEKCRWWAFSAENVLTTDKGNLYSKKPKYGCIIEHFLKAFCLLLDKVGELRPYKPED